MNKEIDNNLDMIVECPVLENSSGSEAVKLPEENSTISEKNQRGTEENQDSNDIPNLEFEKSYENPKEPNENQKQIEKNDNKSIKFKFPFNRIKQIMKADPDCYLVSADAVVLVAKASEMFVESLGKEAFKHIAKRKTIMKKDIDFVINNVAEYDFLDGALDWD